MIRSVASYPFALTIAGVDPSSGAGLTADIKTMECFRCYGLGVASAITVQNDQEFYACHWIDKSLILRQIDVLLTRYRFKVVKIGLIESLETLIALVDTLKKNDPDIRIIWDPVLRASAGFCFHKTVERQELAYVLQQVFLVTPNLDEVLALFGEEKKGIGDLAAEVRSGQRANILVKGGHGDAEKVVDRLITVNGVEELTVLRQLGGVHGSGCILSAAIASLLARGKSLSDACYEAQQYLAHVIGRSAEPLAVHRP